MGTITDAVAEAFRDYNTDGVPASGAYEPAKSDIRAIGPLIEAAIGNAGLGALVSVTKDTRAHLDADLAHAADVVALVYADAADANNDLYVKVGASGSGSWTLTTTVHDVIGGAASSYVADAAASAATAAAAAALLAQTVGRPSTVAAGTTTIGNYVATFLDPVTDTAKVLHQIRYYGAAVGRARIFRSVDIGGVLHQRGPDFFFTTATGSHTVPASTLGRMAFEPGDYVSIDANGLIGLSIAAADGLGFWTTGAGSSSGTPAGPFTTQLIQIGFDFQLDSLAETAAIVVGKGSGAFVAGSGTLDGSNFLFDDPVARDSYISAVHLYAATGGTAVVTVWDGTTHALVATYGITIPSGEAYLTAADFGLIPVAEGQVVGIRGGAGVVTYDGTERGTAYVNGGTGITTYDPGNIGNSIDIQLAFELSPLSALDSTQSDQIAVIAAGSPSPSGISLRARLARYGAVVLLADSIGEHYDATARGNHWFERFTATLLGDIEPNAEIGVTNFRPGSDAIGWYGLSTTGTVSNGTTGPIQSSLVLQSGATISFTGDYASIGFAYDQSSGAGTLTLTRAGGGLSVATSTSGTATPDVIRSAISTSHSGSDTYTLTASGGPVTLTALYRNGTDTAGVNAPRLQRMALTGQSTTLFADDTRLASISKQASAPGRPLYLVALGTNNAASGSGSSTSPTQYGIDLQKIFAKLQQTGDVAAIGLIRPGSGVTPPTGHTFDEYLAELIRVCGLYDVPLLPLAETDFLGRGLTYDGLHPTDGGFVLYDQLAEAWLLGSGFDLVARQHAGRVTLIGSGSPESAAYALDSSEYIRTDTGQRYLKDTVGWGNTGWRAL